jgi:hypothetical protein
LGLNVFGGEIKFEKECVQSFGQDFNLIYFSDK